MFLALRILLHITTGWLVGYTIARVILFRRDNQFADTVIKNNAEFPNYYIQLTSTQIGYMGDNTAIALLSPRILKLAETHNNLYDVSMSDCITEIIVPNDHLPVDKVVLESPWRKFLSPFGK